MTTNVQLGITVDDALPQWCARRLLARIENAVVIACLSLMVALPLLEAFLRRFFAIGIDNVTGLVQHLALIIGTIGAAIAARENELLTFGSRSPVTSTVMQRIRSFGDGVAVAVCIVLCVAAVQFIATERDSGAELAYGIPVWIVQLCIPVALSLIALRLLYAPRTRTPLNGRALIVAAVVVGSVALVPFHHDAFQLLAFATLLLAVIAGVPVFVVIGASAAILIASERIPLASIALDHYSIVTNPTLPAIPLFTLAGFIMAESRAPARLVDVFNAWFGRFKGGAAIATVVACTFFTSFTGASGVTIVALGSLLMPLLSSSGYAYASSLGLITAGGSAGVLLMPALPLILYAIIAKVPIEDMFLAGVLPALLMLSLAVGWGIFRRPRTSQPTQRFDLRHALRTLWIAKWELLLPALVIVCLFSGLMTPIEAAATTAFYAFLIAVFIHRDLSLVQDMPRVLVRCGLLIGGILLILGLALGLTNYIVDARLSERLIGWVTATIESRWAFLLALNTFLLAAGFFVDIFSAIVVIAPLIVPIGLAYGIDPIHLGIIFLANMELGYLTPPVGMNLFFASARFGCQIADVCRAVLPLFLLFAAGVLVITYVPALSTALLMR